MPKFLFPLTAHHLYGEVRILTTIAEFELFCQRHKVSEKHIFHSCYIDPTGAFIRTAHANEWVVRDELGKIVRQGEFDLPKSHWRKRFRKRRGNFEFRSEEHTSELQSLMRISYAVFCLKKKKKRYTYNAKQL